MKRFSILAAAVGVGMIVFAAAGFRHSASATGPCGTTHDGITAEEQTFFGLLQTWRDQNIPSSAPMTLSGPLNAAAAWYAEYQVTSGGNGGHIDNLGRNWVQRATDCGYGGYSGGSGEGVYAISSSGVLNIGPTQAIAGITYPGSGVRIDTTGTSIPAKCAGVAVFRNATGTAVAWVAVIAQYPSAQTCPSAVTGSPPTPTNTNTPTQTNTPTATPTKTSTPTPTPTPQARFGVQLQLAPEGWSLVTLPAGSIAQVLARAYGCYAVVYQLRGETWLRYSPDVPPYARNLSESDGGAFWILGTAKDCGTISL